ncbi:MAG: SMC-Scp complex subunit ScpB [Oscillospiraceae bacterium]
MSLDLDDTLLAVLFAVGDPIAPERIASAMGLEPSEVRRLLEHLRDTLEHKSGALQLLRLGNQYQLATREEYTTVIRQVLNEKRNVSLTPAALEVLAAVAYNQPVTRSYIEQVRGVDSSGIVSQLTEKGLLEESERLELPGRPIAYRTTPHFLRTFGLSSLDDLPMTTFSPSEEDENGFDGQLDFAQLSGETS